MKISNGVTGIAGALSGVILLSQTIAASPNPECRSDNAGLVLPPGFCAVIVADRVGGPRHLTVAANGDIFVAMRDGRGGVLALRDTDGDGVADIRARFGAGEGSDVEFEGGYLS
ncbi:MAG: hypothetical protein IH877_10425, partial [Gemmatimonadetes bacterium]|nr:hypothetical protein [Gemmatimonadota bacterium]